MESFSIFRVSVANTSLQLIVEEEELAPSLRYSIQIGLCRDSRPLSARW